MIGKWAAGSVSRRFMQLVADTRVAASLSGHQLRAAHTPVG